jgi:hypothetical protein
MRIAVRSKVPEEQVRPWKGKHPPKEHYSFVLTESCDVYAPDGTLIIGYRRGAISKEALDQSYETYHYMKRFKSDNRGVYAGESRIPKVRPDGTVSRQTRTSNVSSCVAGFFEAQGGRHPFCRQTAFLQHHPEKWDAIQPCLREVAKVFKDVAPNKYKDQMAYVGKTHQAWVIPGTPFTTLTINNCVPSAYHQDGGDLKDGMGCMLCFRKGEYSGFELVIPEYRFAIDMKHGDVVVFNPVVWHGNTPPYATVGEEKVDWERITVVHYYREGILGCDSPDGELEKAKSRGTIPTGGIND